MLHHQPLFLLDGGHNSQCARALADCVKRYLPGERVTFLMGVLADKEYDRLFTILNEAADAFVCVTPDSPRALPAEELAAFLNRYGKPVTVCASIPEGVETARAAAGAEGMVCAVGSLYMAGAVRACFGLY